MKLKISDTLQLPIEFVTSTQAVLAVKGAGKTHTASVQAEELLKLGQRTVIIDLPVPGTGSRSAESRASDELFGG